MKLGGISANLGKAHNKREEEGIESGERGEGSPADVSFARLGRYIRVEHRRRADIVK